LEEIKCILGFGGKARRIKTTRKIYIWVEDNIKMDLRKIRWGSMDWIHLAQDKDQWTR
jgi:hypothetical protein